MEVSVIIPTKDRLASLQRVLPSFLMQKEVREIVVIVDGSTDGTLEFLKEYCKGTPLVRYLDNGINHGVPYSRNRGIDSANFEYIFMAEDDLELSEGFFRILAEHMSSSGADVICGRNIFRLDTESAEHSIARTNKLGGSYVNMKTIEIQTGMNLKVDQEQPILASPMLAKASLYREVRYNEIYRVNFWREETDFQLSARERGYKLVCCPHAICFNFVFANDRGGVHSAVGWRGEKWVIINNWTFVKKHEQFIRDNFNIGNKRVYITRFAIGRTLNSVVIPALMRPLSRIKRAVLKRVVPLNR
jgi:glycosyltransferase involved in cell wall biosynthesis